METGGGGRWVVILQVEAQLQHCLQHRNDEGIKDLFASWSSEGAARLRKEFAHPASVSLLDVSRREAHGGGRQVSVRLGVCHLVE